MNQYACMILQVNTTFLYFSAWCNHNAHFTSLQEVDPLKFLQCMVLFHQLICLVVLGIKLWLNPGLVF
jgi:hypothetical protein